MAVRVRWRRLRWKRNPRRALRWFPLACVLVPVVLLWLAPAALARSNSGTPNSALLSSLAPSVLPTVCVGGVLICGGGVVSQPTPCVSGSLLCSPAPVPSACVPGVGCTGTIVGPPPSQTPGGNPGGQGSAPVTAPVTAPAAGGGITAAAVVLPAPPGVGLVPPAGTANLDGELNPDALAAVLSLSLRDGLQSTRYHVWPWLLAAQLVLWTAIAAYSWSRDQAAASRRPS